MTSNSHHFLISIPTIINDDGEYLAAYSIPIPDPSPKLIKVLIATLIALSKLFTTFHLQSIHKFLIVSLSQNYSISLL